MTRNHFFAMIHRMRYINRWGLMRNTQQENTQEHALQVAVIAHALAEIRKIHGEENRPVVDSNQALLLAIYHDASEILTGDLPTPVKYYNPEIKKAYKDVESVAVNRLLGMLPAELAPAWQSALCPDLADPATAEAARLVKAADKISAYIKCIDEKKAGNKEFIQAEAALKKTLDNLREELPEVSYFLDNFLPSFELSLDQLHD